jgi:hypothetical protein
VKNSDSRCEQHVNQVQNVSDLFFLESVFGELKENYYKEYKNYRLWDLAVPILHSYLKQHLVSNWNVLYDDHELISLFSKWKEVLEDDTIDLTADSPMPSKQNIDPYHPLIWDVWMPFLRKAIL